MKIRKSIVDKNGKQTTVFVNPFASNKSKTKLPNPVNQKFMSSSNVPAIPAYDDEPSFSSDQVAAYFPEAKGAALYPVKARKGDNAVIRFYTPNIEISKKPYTNGYRDRYIAADLASDLYGLSAGYGHSGDKSYVYCSISKEIPNKNKPSDADKAYQDALVDIHKVRDGKDDFLSQLKKQRGVTLRVQKLNSEELKKVASGNDVMALRAIPHLDHDAIADGDIYLNLAKNPLTPRSTIASLAVNGPVIFLYTEKSAIEAFDLIGKRDDVEDYTKSAARMRIKMLRE